MRIKQTSKPTSKQSIEHKETSQKKTESVANNSGKISAKEDPKLKISRKHHRSRVKQRFEREGIENFNDYEVLELLLFYAIPYRDTKPIAYRLMTEFGSLANVFDADMKDLMKVEGITEHGAIYLNLFSAGTKRYLSSKWQGKQDLKSIREAGELMKEHLKAYATEVFMVVLLDAQNRIINKKILSKGSVNQILVSRRQVVEEAVRSHATSVIIGHNHPGGTLSVSEEDMELTSTLNMVLNGINIMLADHIIVGGDAYLSMRKMGYLK